MKVTLLVVGKTADPHIGALVQGYTGRLAHYLPFSVQVIPDLRSTKSLSPGQQKQAEGDLILRAVPPSADLVLLDEHGTCFRSVEFAQYMQRKMTAARDLTFVVGGAYGFPPSVYARADAKLSLSPMTFSHQMIRLLFVEQLYRAMTILRGEPYHHE